MSEKDRLLRTLFGRPNRKLLNIKFHRTDGVDVNLTEDRFCAEVNKVIFAIDEGLLEPSPTLAVRAKRKVNVKELAKRI